MQGAYRIMADKKEMTIEEGFERLAQIKKSMESVDVSLEESFKLYQEGIEIIKACNDKLDTTEKQVQMIAADGKLVAFQEEEE